MTFTKSHTELSLDKILLDRLGGKAKELVQLMIDDEEIRVLQEYANIVSMKRLGFNDHGPVHMRQASVNALQIVDLLQANGVVLSLQNEGAGSLDDSLIAILLAAFLHDSGMTLTRSIHEQTALPLTLPIIERLLNKIYGNDNQRFIVRSLAMEAILGHMAITPIHSLEAGIILVADGCDMKKGRARIPLAFMRGDSHEGKVGDMHKYSAEAIEDITITQGDRKPIKIEIEMSSSIGFFQVEEVLIPKISKSPIKSYIELFGKFNDGRDYKQYL